MDSPAIKALPNVGVEAPSSNPGGLAASLGPASDGALVVEPGKTKRCTVCKKILPISEFFKNKACKDDINYRCRSCCKKISKQDRLKKPEKYKERNKKYVQEHHEQILEKGRRYRQIHREEINESVRKYRRENLEEYQKVRKENSLKKLYGLTMDKFHEMIKTSKNRCAICNEEFAKDNPPHIDHDHTKNKGDNDFIRGLLCGKCNKGIGLLGDDLKGLLRAVEYLQKTSLEQEVPLEGQSPPSHFSNLIRPPM